MAKNSAKNLIAMTKDGRTIQVSPLTVEDHQRVGWKLVEGVSEKQLADKKFTAAAQADEAQASNQK